MIPIILDFDNTMGIPGKDVDDGLALLYLLGAEVFDLLAITTTYGNSTIEAVHPNTQSMLTTLGLEDLPLYKGAESPANRNSEAAEALVRLVNARPGQITLLGLGSLTNFLGAQEVDPDFFSKVKSIVLMGGVEKPLEINGKSMRELNFSCDPQAAHAVLHAGAQVSVITGHLCLQAVFSRDTYQLMTKSNESGIFAYIRQKTEPWIDFIGSAYEMDGFHNWDAVAALFVNHPELFETDTCSIHSSIADLSEGRLVTGKAFAGNKIHLPRRILDINQFNNTLIKAWGKVPIEKP